MHLYSTSEKKTRSKKKSDTCGGDLYYALYYINVSLWHVFKQ